MKLGEYIQTAEGICRALAESNVGNIKADTMRPADRFRYELLRFAVYLASSDGTMDDRELGIISEYLKVSADCEQIKQLKGEEYLLGTFGQQVPSILKYAVLADAGHKIHNDPNRCQNAMIMYDTFGLFGQTMLSVHDREPDASMIKRYTEYMAVMENFIKKFTVWYAGDQKLYRPEMISADSAAAGASQEEREKHLEELLEQLNSMTGLTGVKKQVNSLVNLIKVQSMRKEQGLKCSDVSKHMVFSGNPGTGKTTVARLLAEIYKYLGVIKSGQLVETDRSGLVRGYVGQTASRVQEVVSDALGGILFVDEAYALTVNKGEGDFGQEAVDTLLKAMEDHRDELIVIVAGYTDLMEQFLSSNPGLKSRFSNFIMFEDYTSEELMEILESMLKKQDYMLSDAARSRAFEMIRDRVEHKPDNFANARDIRNYMEHAISNHATRVVGEKNADKNVLSTIEAADVEGCFN